MRRARKRGREEQHVGNSANGLCTRGAALGGIGAVQCGARWPQQISIRQEPSSLGAPPQAAKDVPASVLPVGSRARVGFGRPRPPPPARVRCLTSLVHAPSTKEGRRDCAWALASAPSLLAAACQRRVSCSWPKAGSTPTTSSLSKRGRGAFSGVPLVDHREDVPVRLVHQRTRRTRRPG